MEKDDKLTQEIYGKPGKWSLRWCALKCFFGYHKMIVLRKEIDDGDRFHLCERCGNERTLFIKHI